MGELTSLERVIKAVTHQKVDRIPLDIGSSFTTGITKDAYCRLAKQMGKVVTEPQLFDVVQQLAVVDDEMAELLGCDVRGVVPNIVRKNPTIKIVDGVNGTWHNSIYSVGLWEDEHGYIPYRMPCREPRTKEEKGEGSETPCRHGKRIHVDLGEYP